ncbi:MAG: hypothetical protein WC531_03120 [Candidatus Paceibacterota bacterium]|jgi:acid phosphatase class B
MTKLAQKTKKTIGFDLDDTIIDHEPNRIKLSRKLNLPKHDQRLKKILYAEISAKARPLKNARLIVRKLSKDGYRLIIVSRRKRGGRQFGRQWLADHLPAIKKSNVFFVDKDKDKTIICRQQQVEIFIDDSLEVLEHLDKKIKKIPFRKNWLAIYRQIKKVN